MADGNRRIARALYERAGQSEKKQAREFFEKLDSNRDGKISLGEFKRGVDSGLSNEKVFNELDSNRDGFLDSNDVLVLFYYNIKKAITILRCRGCSKLIFGPSYSCFECLFNTADRRFALCRDCYGKGKVKHPHPLTSTTSSTATAGELLRDQALLLKFSDLISSHPRTLTKKDLKKLWEDAKSQTGQASPAVETMADNYFKSMGSNNGLDIKKFSTLTKQQEAFLTPGPNTSRETAYMLDAFRTEITQSRTPSPAIHENRNAASSSIPQRHYVNPSSDHRPNPETSSNGTVSISPMKVATTVVKIVEMALTIAEISSMCTIM